MRSAPCKKCERRGCGSYHDECAEFLAWTKENELLKQAKMEEALADTIILHHRHVAYKIWAKTSRR